MLLLDTDILIDILRRYGPALDWLQYLGDEPVGLPGFVAMELLQGCRNGVEQRRIENVVSGYVLYWPTHVDSQRALETFASIRLRHGIGILDTLIAETRLV